LIGVRKGLFAKSLFRRENRPLRPSEKVVTKEKTQGNDARQRRKATTQGNDARQRRKATTQGNELSAIGKQTMAHAYSAMDFLII
jgi:hypothetical protein